MTAAGDEPRRARARLAVSAAFPSPRSPVCPPAEPYSSSSALDDVRAHGAVGAALRALFMPSGDTGLFGALMRDSVSTRDATLVTAAAKARLRVQDNAYELLAARDMLAETSATLSGAAEAATDASARVAGAKEALKRTIAARRNVDAALDVVARTRTLVRMYARAEDMAASRRLHAALRTLGRLDEAVAAANDETVLRALVPPSDPLRSDMLAHVRRALHSWLGAVRGEMAAVGSYALSYARRRGRAQVEVDADGDAAPVPAAAAPRWIPAVYDDVRGGVSSVSSKWLRAAKQGMQPASSAPRAPDAGHGPGREGSGAADGGEGGDGDWSERSPPRVSMRLLLTCVLTCRDLGRLDGFAADYCRERAKQLDAGIDAILQDRSKPLVPPDATATARSSLPPPPPRQSPQTLQALQSLRRVEEHARLSALVTGFFTVERAVATHSSTRLVAPTLMDQMWAHASGIVSQSAADTGRVDAEGAKRLRASQHAFRSFARMYGFEEASPV